MLSSLLGAFYKINPPTSEVGQLIEDINAHLTGNHKEIKNHQNPIATAGVKEKLVRLGTLVDYVPEHRDIWMHSMEKYAAMNEADAVDAALDIALDRKGKNSRTGHEAFFFAESRMESLSKKLPNGWFQGEYFDDLMPLLSKAAMFEVSETAGEAKHV